MKNILKIGMLTLSVFLQACAIAPGRWENAPDRISTDEPGGYEKNYQLGVGKSAFIGQEIINVKKYNKTILSALSLDRVTIASRYRRDDIKGVLDGSLQH